MDNRPHGLNQMTLGLAIALSVMGHLESEEMGTWKEYDSYAWSAQAQRDRMNYLQQEALMQSREQSRQANKQADLNNQPIIDGEFTVIEDKSDGRE